MSDNKQIIAGARAGLSKSELEAILQRKLADDEDLIFRKTKAAIKLKKAMPENPNPDYVPATGNQLPQPISQRYSEDQVEAVVEQANGMANRIIRLLDSSFHQWNVYCATHPKIAKLAKKLRLAMVDRAEAVVDAALGSNDEKTRLDAAKYVLKTQGKDRGWGEAQIAQQIDVDNKGNVSVKAIFGLPDGQ